VIKAIVEWRVRRRRADAAAAARVDSTGTLVASGLIAGESLTGVLLAGLVLLADKMGFVFTSVAGLLFGVPEFGYVSTAAGGWASLVPLAVLVWVLVVIPLRKAAAAPA
jgi:hypothetical protein